LARHRFAVVVLAVAALASSCWLLLDVISQYTQSSEAIGVAGFETRFDEMRKALPPKSVLGYTSDNASNDPSNPAEFYLTQYTLAPRILKPNTAERMVVANFHNPKPDRRALRKAGLDLVQDYGQGVFLCRNLAQ